VAEGFALLTKPYSTAQLQRAMAALLTVPASEPGAGLAASRLVGQAEP
jgi:hypothetical protein